MEPGREEAERQRKSAWRTGLVVGMIIGFVIGAIVAQFGYPSGQDFINELRDMEWNEPMRFKQIVGEILMDSDRFRLIDLEEKPSEFEQELLAERLKGQGYYVFRDEYEITDWIEGHGYRLVPDKEAMRRNEAALKELMELLYGQPQR